MEPLKSTELRIGNLIRSIDAGENELDGPVFNILQSYCRIRVDNELEDIQVYYDSAFGIPLSESWLERYGFERTNALEFGNLFLETFRNGQMDVSTSGLVHYRETCIHYDVNFVHQLQNLYHALTGHELEIKQHDPTGK